MQQWFNLLIQVAQPILTTLAYTGTNLLLDTVQSEITKQQTKQAKRAYQALGMKEKQAVIAKRLLQDTSLSLKPEKEQLRIAEKQLVADYSLINQQNFCQQLAQQAQTTALKLPEITKSLEYWPLRLLPNQLIQPRFDNSPIPIKILMVPPAKISTEFKAINIEATEIEQILAQNLREFLSQHYPSQSSSRPTEFLGGAWNQQNFPGEASIKTLFGVLQTEPTLILETAIENHFIILRLGYWSGQQKQYCYETLLKLPLRSLIEKSITTRALKWQITQTKLLKLGKSPEQIAALSGDNGINLAIFQEIRELKAAGIETEELSFTYQVSRQDFNYICQFLSICQCLVAGWVTDIHYLIENNLTPHLPTCLPQLFGKAAEASESLSEIASASISIYQRVVSALVPPGSNSLAQLSLKLAHSLLPLDLVLATEQLEYSWRHWLQQRQLSALTNEEKLDLEAIKKTITAKDREYLRNLQACLSLLAEKSDLTHIQKPINHLCDRHCNYATEKGEHLALDYTLTEISGQVCCLWLDATNCKLIGKDSNKTLALWQLKRHKVQLSPTHQLKGYVGKVNAVSLSPDGNKLVCSDTTAKRSYLRIWHLQRGKLERSLFGHKQSIQSLAISAGNQPFLASASHKIKLWNLQTGEPWLTLFGHKKLVYALAIAPDSQTLVSGSEDKTIRIWHLSKGDLVKTLTGHQAAIKVIAITPDSQTIISGSDDQTIKLWNLKTGKLLRTLTGHQQGISSLAIAPDCQYLVSGSKDKTIKIWDFASGKLRQTLLGHEHTIRTLAIHPNRQTIVSGSDDKTIKFWRII